MLLPFRAQTNPDPSPKPNPDQTHSWRRSQYEWIVLTRLDFLGGVTLCDSSVAKRRGPACLLPQGVGSIWELMAAQRLDMIGRREGKSGYRIEDRLMLGRRATMLRLESAYAHYTSGTLRARAGANSGIAAPSKCRGAQLLTRREPQPLAQGSHFMGLPPEPTPTDHSTGHPGIAEVFLNDLLSGAVDGRVQPRQPRRFGNVDAYFEWPLYEGTNPHRFAQCFFRRSLPPLELLPLGLLSRSARVCIMPPAEPLGCAAGRFCCVASRPSPLCSRAFCRAGASCGRCASARGTCCGWTPCSSCAPAPTTRTGQGETARLGAACGTGATHGWSFSAATAA